MYISSPKGISTGSFYVVILEYHCTDGCTVKRRKAIQFLKVDFGPVIDPPEQHV